MELRVNGRTVDPETIAREAMLYKHTPDAEGAARRALAVRTLLLQRAVELGMVDGSTHGDVTFASREEEDALVARVLDREVRTPTPTKEEARRYYAAHAARFTSGELVEARHILFAVTAGTPAAALRERARGVLEALREAPEQFAEQAQAFSNCPSAAHGGSLGQFDRAAVVPEFERAVFGTTATGILPELVATRHGFHIVDVVRRIPGRLVPFEDIADRVAECLAAEVERNALRQYVTVLAGGADIEGVTLEQTPSPLVQ